MVKRRTRKKFFPKRSSIRRSNTRSSSLRPGKLSMTRAFSGIRTVGAPSGKAVRKVAQAMAAGTRIGKRKKPRMVKVGRFI